jgi:hypothetical protein
MGSFGIDQGFMCNGANLYTKSFFTALKVWNDGIASGDDVFYYKKPLNNFQTKYII